MTSGWMQHRKKKFFISYGVRGRLELHFPMASTQHEMVEMCAPPAELYKHYNLCVGSFWSPIGPVKWLDIWKEHYLLAKSELRRSVSFTFLSLFFVQHNIRMESCRSGWCAGKWWKMFSANWQSSVTEYTADRQTGGVSLNFIYLHVVAPLLQCVCVLNTKLLIMKQFGNNSFPSSYRKYGNI